jgi:hypothetical protein
LVHCVQAEVLCQRFQFIFGIYRCALRHMPVSCPVPGTFRPPSGLKSRMQLPHIVQKSQDGKALYDRWSKHAAYHSLNAGAERGQRDNALKARCYIGAVMSEVMGIARKNICLCPWSLRHEPLGSGKCSRRQTSLRNCSTSPPLGAELMSVRNVRSYHYTAPTAWTILIGRYSGRLWVR